MISKHIILATVLLASLTLLPSCTTDEGKIEKSDPADTISETVTITGPETKESITEEVTPTKSEIPELGCLTDL